MTGKCCVEYILLEKCMKNYDMYVLRHIVQTQIQAKESDCSYFEVDFDDDDDGDGDEAGVVFICLFDKKLDI